MDGAWFLIGLALFQAREQRRANGHRWNARAVLAHCKRRSEQEKGLKARSNSGPSGRCNEPKQILRTKGETPMKTSRPISVTVAAVLLALLGLQSLAFVVAPEGCPPSSFT